VNDQLRRIWRWSAKPCASRSMLILNFLGKLSALHAYMAEESDNLALVASFASLIECRKMLTANCRFVLPQVDR
jgi:hypothetical protein